MKFSIIIPAHNAENYISNALESIIEQTFTDYELIVICDACVDRTAEMAREAGAIDIECAVSIMNLDWDGHNITYTHCKGSGIYGVAQARNNLVQQAIDGGFDKLFMIDSDMIVPEDAIINLLDPDVPIVTGCARFKNDSRRAPLFTGVQDSTGSDAWLWDEIPDGRFAIRSGGVACAMIDVEMLRRKIRRPWFVWEERANGTYVGEDIHFYEEITGAGITPYADGRVRCGHIGRQVYD